MNYTENLTKDKARKGEKTKERTISSLEVAEMMETEHWKLLRKLEGDKKTDGIIKILADNNFVVSDYFIRSTYRDTSGKENKCYEVTRLGCDFLANKFTGEKGVIFTARYVKRFHDMEDYIKDNATNTIEQGIGVVKFIADDLNVNTASRLLMYENYCKDVGIPTGFLPKYERNGSREMKPLTVLLKENGCGITAQKLNPILIKYGYVEERERKSSKGNGIRRFKALTEKGLKFGENAVSPHNQREVQPLYYSDTFMELFGAVMN